MTAGGAVEDTTDRTPVSDDGAPVVVPLAHHRNHWADGGETRLDNLVLLCFHHHRLVHEAGYTIETTPEHRLLFRNHRRLARPDVPPRPPSGNVDDLLAANESLEIGPTPTATAADTSSPSTSGSLLLRSQRSSRNQPRISAGPTVTRRNHSGHPDTTARPSSTVVCARVNECSLMIFTRPLASRTYQRVSSRRDRQAVRLSATSYLSTDALRPGVSPGAMAFKASSPRL